MSLEQQPRWRLRGRAQWSTVGVAVVVTLGILIFIGHQFPWTGFGDTPTRPKVEPPKTQLLQQDLIEKSAFIDLLKRGE